MAPSLASLELPLYNNLNWEYKLGDDQSNSGGLSGNVGTLGSG